MTRRGLVRLIILIILALLLVLLLRRSAPEPELTVEPYPYKVYIPMVLSYAPLDVHGAQMWSVGSTSYAIDYMTAYIPHYMNGTDYRHEQIMPPLWNYQMVLGYRFAPQEWLACSKECCPPAREHFQDYADMIIEQTREHLADGYNIIAIAVDNEPHGDPEDFTDLEAHYTNCYGNGYVGGAYYGDLTEVVYDALKETGWPIILLAGELATTEGSEWRYGMKDHGKFDAVSYHFYPRDWIGNYSDTLTWGEQLADFYEKPVWLTETSVLGSGSEEHQQHKGEYMEYLLNNFAHPMFWFTMADNGWYNTDLCMTRTIGCTPAYYELQEFLER